MFKPYRAAPVALLLAALGVSGCSGGDSNIQASSTTVGQELMDLEESYKKGLITEKEYERTKKLILNRYR